MTKLSILQVRTFVELILKLKAILHIKVHTETTKYRNCDNYIFSQLKLKNEKN